MVSYGGSAIFLIESPDLEPRAALGGTDPGETAKLRDQTLSPRLLIRVGGRATAAEPQAIAPSEGEQRNRLIGRSRLGVVA